MKERDVVQLLIDLPTKGLVRGEIGEVIFMSPYEVYQVKFPRPGGGCIEVFVHEDEIKVLS